MLSAIFTGLFLQLAALTLTALVGLGWVAPAFGDHVSGHMLLALVSALLTLFVQTVVLFYSMAAGRRVKDLSEAGKWATGNETEHREMLKTVVTIRKKIWPFAITSIVLVILTFWLGAATHTHATSDSRLHLGFAIATLLTSLIAIVLEMKWLPKNEAMMDLAWVKYGEYENPLKEETF